MPSTGTATGFGMARKTCRRFRVKDGRSNGVEQHMVFFWYLPSPFCILRAESVSYLVATLLSLRDVRRNACI